MIDRAATHFLQQRFDVALCSGHSLTTRNIIELSMNGGSRNGEFFVKPCSCVGDQRPLDEWELAQLGLAGTGTLQPFLQAKDVSREHVVVVQVYRVSPRRTESARRVLALHGSTGTSNDSKRFYGDDGTSPNGNTK